MFCNRNGYKFGNRNDVHFAGKAAKTLRGGTGVTRRMCHRHVPTS